MPKTIVNVKELRQYICKGCVRVINKDGNHDIINGKYLGRHIASGYVVAILC